MPSLAPLSPCSAAGVRKRLVEFVTEASRVDFRRDRGLCGVFRDSRREVAGVLVADGTAGAAKEKPKSTSFVLRILYRESSLALALGCQEERAYAAPRWRICSRNSLAV